MKKKLIAVSVVLIHGVVDVYTDLNDIFSLQLSRDEILQSCRIKDMEVNEKLWNADMQSLTAVENTALLDRETNLDIRANLKSKSVKDIVTQRMLT